MSPPPLPPIPRRRPNTHHALWLSLVLGGVGCVSLVGFCLLSLVVGAIAWYYNETTPAQPGYAATDAAVTHSSTQINSAGVPVTIEQFEPATPGKYPVVLVIHGLDGLQSSGWRRYYTGQCQELARNGYVALLVHYFEGTGTKTAGMAEAQQHGQAWALTLLDAAAHAMQLPCAKGDRVGMVGTSAGGVLAVSLAMVDTRVGAVVQISGVLPDEMLDKINNRPPVLILHGGADPYISLARVTATQQKMAAKQVPVESHIYPGQRHLFKGADAEDALQRTVKFMQKHLK